MKATIALFASAVLLASAAASAQTPSPAPSPAVTGSPVPATPAPPVDKPSLTPPPGWNAAPAMMNMGSFTMLNVWRPPQASRHGDNINLGYSANPTGADLAAVVPQTRALLQQMLGAGNVTDHAEKLCGGTANGWLFHGKLAMGAMHMVVDEAMLVTSHDVFAATYTRLSEHPADPAARKAIDSLCATPA